jgi:phosphatidylserine decarboxylase
MDYLRYSFTRLFGFFARQRLGWFTTCIIKLFIRAYQVNMREACQVNAKDYPTFNLFFTRALKAGARNIAPHWQTLVSPADGTIAEMGTIHKNSLIQAKGHSYTLEDLLAGDEQASQFYNGFYSTIYLSPKDYHRVHMPLAGKCYQATYIPGKLLSVKLKTAAKVPNLFANNERVVCYFETEFGKMVVILVGAMIVGSISLAWQGILNLGHSNKITTWHYDQPLSLEKGEELGLFQLGSTAIILCENNPTAHWQAHETKRGEHCQYGQALAERIS